MSAWAPSDPEHVRAGEYLRCLVSLPWTVRSAPLDLARARAVLDAGHAAHGAVKERLIDYVAVRLANPDVPSPVLSLVGAPGVGKSTLARQLAAALGRACAWLPCGGLGSAAALHGARSGPPGRIVEELRRGGVRNPVFVLDEVDRLDEAGGGGAALFEALDPAPGVLVTGEAVGALIRGYTREAGVWGLAFGARPLHPIRPVPTRPRPFSRAGFARRISARLNPVSCAGVQRRRQAQDAPAESATTSGRTTPCGRPPTWAADHTNDGRMPPRVGRRPLHSRRHGVPDVSSAGAAPNGHTRCGATGASPTR